MRGGDLGKMNDQLRSHPAMRDVSLSDKFEVTDGTIFITGKQALARVPLCSVSWIVVAACARPDISQAIAARRSERWTTSC